MVVFRSVLHLDRTGGVLAAQYQKTVLSTSLYHLGSGILQLLIYFSFGYSKPSQHDERRLFPLTL